MEPSRHHVGNYFVGVGAQKAGTTWLHDQLARHPEIGLPARKELHYFDSIGLTRSGQRFGRHFLAARNAIENDHKERLRQLIDMFEIYIAGDELYREYLEQSRQDGTKIVGEITPAYSTLSRRGFKSMDKILAPRVIFIMRDPFQRYWSMVRMMEPNDERAQARFDRIVRGQDNWDRGDYRATVKLLDSVFPPDRILYLFYEELFSEHSLRAVANFLGVHPEWDWDLSHKALVGRELTMPQPDDTMLRRFGLVYDFIRERFGNRVPDSWDDLRQH